MIFYYSGTGNSAYAAKEISRMTGDKSGAAYIPQAMRHTHIDISAEEGLGFVFPIYSWGVPPIVLEFIGKLPARVFESRYLWAVCTCGDEAGAAMRKFAKAVKRAGGREPDLMMSLIMPNNYVLLPGFNVDTEEVANRKLSEAPYRLRAISELILKKEPCVRDVHEGSMPAIRSLAYPLFKRWGVNPRRWRVGDGCVACGKCGRICPVGNITYGSEGRPVWGKNCLSCCACYHVCPRQAISYGNFTKGKGQYLFPGYTSHC